MKNIRVLSFFLLLAVGLLFAAVGCETVESDNGNDGTEENGEEDDTPPPLVPAPDSLTGTFAFDESAGVVFLAFMSVDEGVGVETASRTVSEVSGTIRYEEINFDLTGSYDDQTGDIEGSAEGGLDGTAVLFEISVVYAPDEVPEGTITMTVGDGDPRTGPISFIAETEEELLIVNYLGIYAGGGMQGTWNFTVSGEELTGTYYGVAQNGEPTYGWLVGEVTDNSCTLTITDDDGDTGSANGTFEEDVMYGDWVFGLSENSNLSYGISTGIKTDENGDPLERDGTEPDAYKTCRFLQALHNADLTVDRTTGEPPVTYYNSDSTIIEDRYTNEEERDEGLQTYEDFLDPHTGLAVNGTILTTWDTRYTLVDYCDQILDLELDEEGLETVMLQWDIGVDFTTEDVTVTGACAVDGNEVDTDLLVPIFTWYRAAGEME